ncbi:hypothetical protein COP1_041712 [Malus domestica]
MNMLEVNLDSLLELEMWLLNMYSKGNGFMGTSNITELKIDAVVGTTVTEMNGKTSKGIELFTKIGMKPDDFTFIVVLTDCVHRGLVDEGCVFLFFNSKRKIYEIERGSNTMVA